VSIRLALLALLAASAMDGAGNGAPAGDTVIEHVTVLPMTSGADQIHDMNVVIRAGRILSISREPTSLGGAKRINGRGKFLMPAMADMHVHIEDSALISRVPADSPVKKDLDAADLLLPYVANGVLQIFSLSSTEETRRLRDAVESEEIAGPHIALAARVDGPSDAPLASSFIATEPERGREIVRQVSRSGYDAVKVYSRLDFATFKAIAEEARRAGLRLVGHLPLRGQSRTLDLLSAGLELVVHAEEFAYQAPTVDASQIPAMISLAQTYKVSVVTTVRTNERVVERTRSPSAALLKPEIRYVHPAVRYLWKNANSYAGSPERLARRESVVRYNQIFMPCFVNSGLRFFVGTDALIAGVVPGFGIHEELETLSRMGIPNSTILLAATRWPAEWLGTINDRGTVEIGKRADLVLLDGDPMAKIRNTRRISAVFAGGRVFSKAQIDEQLAALARRYADGSPQ
jgi:imidazolonepropionase-like amidohydrolase